VLLLAAALVAALTVRPAGGHLDALGQVRMRLVPAILGALCLQVVIISVLPQGSPGLHRVLHVASYALAAAFLVANRRIRGTWIIALGAALNLVAILANDGVMPASRSALRAAGIATKSQGFANSSAVAHPRLLQLGDILYVPKPWPLHNVFSIGDICIAIGVMIAVHALSGSRLVKPRVRATDHRSDRQTRPRRPTVERSGL
jgi:hypothetical protein